MTTPDDISTSDRTGIAELRIRKELRAAAREIDLTPGSELRAVTTGRRRHQRRRRATTFALVTALGAGTAFGIQRLASSGGGERVALDEPELTGADGDDETTGSDAPVAASPSVPDDTATPVPGTAPAATDDTIGDAPLAEIVESDMVWNVVAVDSAEAVSFAQGAFASNEVPGVLLATAPGRSNQYEPTWWSTEDGITWQPLPLDVPIGRVEGAVFDGASVYAVGTAPGIAASDPNPFVLASSDDRGVTWDQITLPVDTNAGRELPLVRGVSAGATPIPIEGGTLVIVTRWFDLDWDKLAAESGKVSGGIWGFDATGATFMDSSDCAQGDTELVELGATFTATTVPAGAMSEQCGLTTYSWDELDLPAETLALVQGGQTQGFRVVGGEVTEVDVPAGAYVAGMVGGRVRLSTADGQSYVATETGAIVESEQGLGDPSWPVGERDGVLYSTASRNSAFGGWNDLFGAGTDGSWTWADWGELYGADMLATRVSSGVTAAGLTAVASVVPDPLAADGGAEITTEGITIRRASQRSGPEFSYADSGEAIPLSSVRADPSNGDIVVLDAAGGETARLRGEVVGAMLYGGFAPDASVQPTWYVETSTDAAHVAVQSLADLLGVTDDDISSVPRISTDGTNAIVVVTMDERDADGVPKQLVLVGTPRT